jgi:hypothetical protein
MPSVVGGWEWLWLESAQLAGGCRRPIPPTTPDLLWSTGLFEQSPFAPVGHVDDKADQTTLVV